MIDTYNKLQTMVNQRIIATNPGSLNVCGDYLGYVRILEELAGPQPSVRARQNARKEIARLLDAELEAGNVPCMFYRLFEE